MGAANLFLLYLSTFISWLLMSDLNHPRIWLICTQTTFLLNAKFGAENDRVSPSGTAGVIWASLNGRVGENRKLLEKGNASVPFPPLPASCGPFITPGFRKHDTANLSSVLFSKRAFIWKHMESDLCSKRIEGGKKKGFEAWTKRIEQNNQENLFEVQTNYFWPTLASQSDKCKYLKGKKKLNDEPKCIPIGYDDTMCCLQKLQENNNYRLKGKFSSYWKLREVPFSLRFFVVVAYLITTAAYQRAKDDVEKGHLPSPEQASCFISALTAVSTEI